MSLKQEISVLGAEHWAKPYETERGPGIPATLGAKFGEWQVGGQAASRPQQCPTEFPRSGEKAQI